MFYFPQFRSHNETKMAAIELSSRYLRSHEKFSVYFSCCNNYIDELFHAITPFQVLILLMTAVLMVFFLVSEPRDNIRFLVYATFHLLRHLS